MSRFEIFRDLNFLFGWKNVFEKFRSVNKIRDQFVGNFREYSNEKFNLELDRSKELCIEIWYRDYRAMAAIKYVKLEDLLDNDFNDQMCLELEPQGKVFVHLGFQNPRVERNKRKLQRQRRLFKKKNKDIE